MKLMLDINIPSPTKKIEYTDKIFLIGSCFTEHIGGRLKDHKFSVLQNPNGILFDPVSVSKSLVSYIDEKQYLETDLFYLNELWQSWNHHSIYSGINTKEVLEKINESQHEAHLFLKEAKWIIITLGSSFSYQLAESGIPVANCHRAPSNFFNKHLLSIDETIAALENAVSKLLNFNPEINIVFTISPVRHIRDGVIENNRSKSRLIEAVHQIICKYDKAYYFPAYEIVIDVLRDYRFYDIDLVHPNYAATEFVFDKFAENYISANNRELMEEVKKIVTAFRHKPFQPATKAHKKFMQSFEEKARKLQQKFPFLDLSNEVNYFSSLSDTQI